MASQGYYDWLNAGKPYTLILPAKHMQAKVRVYGITVYDYPNEAHQKADRPQDHTPYSVTGWPGTNKRWNARALDIMPRSSSYAHRKENADIARQIIRDRDAGHPGVKWIKYMNWTSESGVCLQERWTDSSNPNRRTTVSSNDRDHIHISGRSDHDTYAGAEGYDPIKRMLGLVESEPDMDQAERDMLSRCERILTAMCTRLMPEIGAGETPNRDEIKLEPTWANGPATVPNPIDWMMNQFLLLNMHGIDTEALAEDIANRVIAADTNALTEDDKPVITAAVKDAMRQGTE